jgi:hypothetical protein
MTEAFERKGIWWLPHRPEKRVYGTLKFDPVTGARLDLFGSLRGDADDDFLQSEIVLGEYSSGKPITLYRCYENKQNISAYALTTSEGFPVTGMIINYVFDGHHFSSEADIQFQSLNVGFSHLRNWADATRIKTSCDREKIEASYAPPQDIEAHLPQVGTITLAYGSSLSHTFSNAKINKTFAISLEAPEPKSFEEWWRVIYLLRVFFSLATRHAVHPLHLEETVEVEVEYPDGEIGKTCKRTDIFFRLKQVPSDSSTEGPNNMLFTLKDLGGEWESCLQNWFAKADLLEPVYELYFGTLHNAGMYPIHQFSSLIQALESYHRRTSNKTSLPKAEFRQRIRAILEAVPEGLRSWLQSKLNFSNELPLGQRLEEIMATYCDIFGTYKDQAAFIKRVKDTRNYLTHYDAKSRGKAAHGEELHNLSSSLKLLVEMCLLKELGLSDKAIRHVLTRGQMSRCWFEHPPRQPNQESTRENDEGALEEAVG